MSERKTKIVLYIYKKTKQNKTVLLKGRQTERLKKSLYVSDQIRSVLTSTEQAAPEDQSLKEAQKLHTVNSEWWAGSCQHLSPVCVVSFFLFYSFLAKYWFYVALWSQQLGLLAFHSSHRCTSGTAEEVVSVGVWMSGLVKCSQCK